MSPGTNQPKAEGKAFCVEANNPDESTQWKFLWEFDEEDRVKTQELLDELNIINAPCPTSYRSQYALDDLSFLFVGFLQRLISLFNRFINRYINSIFRGEHLIHSRQSKL
jgi:hypothetical protein